jgi:hypothetical protein
LVGAGVLSTDIVGGGGGGTEGGQEAGDLVVLVLFVGQGKIEVLAAAGEEIDRGMGLGERKKESREEYN